MQTDVVVPVHGGWDHVREALASLEAQLPPVRIIVVDDMSLDDTATRIEQSFPGVTLLRTSMNVGFGAACNVGFAESTADFVAVVNSDVVLLEDAIQRLIEPFDDPSVGSTTGVLISPDGAIDAAGVVIDRAFAGFVQLHGAPIEKLESARTPGVVYGALAAFRASALRQTGAFDEAIFMYGEELELGLRLQATGWRCSLAIDARGTHIGGASIGYGSPRQRRLAGFGRGYVMRAYHVTWNRGGMLAVAMEILAVFSQLTKHKDISGLIGRVQGWRAAKGVRRARPISGVIGFTFWEGIRLRRGRYW